MASAKERTVQGSTKTTLPFRGADVFVGGKKCGVFGEVHPHVLENWNIGVPATLGEVDLDTLLVK